MTETDRYAAVQEAHLAMLRIAAEYSFHQKLADDAKLRYGDARRRYEKFLHALDYAPPVPAVVLTPFDLNAGGSGSWTPPKGMPEPLPCLQGSPTRSSPSRASAE